MARRYNRYGGHRYSGRTPNPGLERALQHIEDARELTAQLGGTDEDVKSYFFNLPPRELAFILDEYGKRHGQPARVYAEETMDQWRSGAREMSGMVAARLFGLLPPRMPTDKKYELVENLWRRLGPRSFRVFTLGYNVPTDLVVATVRDSLLGQVRSFTIPSQLENRFEWLAAGDVTVRQQLLNHLQDMEKNAILAGVSIQVPVILQHLNSSEGQTTQSAAQEIKIGNHAVRLEFRRGHDGITEGSLPPPRIRTGSNDGSYIGWVMAGVAVLLAFLLFM